MKRIFSPIALFCLLSLLPAQSKSQDSISVMHYNLLRYGASGIGGCTPTGVTARNAWLTTIMTHTLPDIIGVNEIGPVEGVTAPATNLLNNILKPINPAYERAQVTFDGSQDIANCLFYNGDKLGLSSQAVIPHSFRHINYYKLYYKGPGLTAGDTTWLEIVEVHLSADNSSIRASQTTAIMTYLCGLNRPGNFIVMGDFNLDASSETSYQNMVGSADPDCKMNDPINLSGTWSNNTNAKHAWSQSTRSTSSNDCGSGGGLDDRFDFILASNSIMNNTEDIRYIPSTYRVVGNPYSPNPSVPTNVSSALAPMSDHHPVMLTLEVSRAVSVDENMEQEWVKVISNPVNESVDFELQVLSGVEGNWNWKIVDMMGRAVAFDESWLASGLHRISLSSMTWTAGLYYLQVQAADGRSVCKRFLVQH